ncbi:MAG TPA: hypothetical protein VEP90_07410 [Methylomirabilota bacterium]|nr:hypothetical protein [Methylomirabilota bacterium]
MNSDQVQQQTQVKDNVYLKIWQTEQAHQRTRWTVVTFFLGISFAIFGFSFQNKFSPSEALAFRISGLFIYWFAYILLLHFYVFTRFLRNYLLEMEKSGRTTLDIQSKADRSHIGSSKLLSTTRLLFLFGSIYTVGIIALRLLSL